MLSLIGAGDERPAVLLRALEEHLPAGVLGDPVLVDEDSVLDDQAQLFGIDSGGAWRFVGIGRDTSEVTRYLNGQEVSRAASIPRPAT